MILSDAEIYKRCEWRSIPTMQDVAKIQHRATLEQLEKDRMLIHDLTIRSCEGIEHYECHPDCRACKLLREVGL